MNDIAHQDEVVAVLKKSIQGADVSLYPCIEVVVHEWLLVCL